MRNFVQWTPTPHSCAVVISTKKHSGIRNEGSLLPLLNLDIFQENKLAFVTTRSGKLNYNYFFSRLSNKYLYDVSPPQFYVHFSLSHACKVCGWNFSEQGLNNFGKKEPCAIPVTLLFECPPLMLMAPIRTTKTNPYNFRICETFI